jgi:hypothetical protein
MGGASDLFIKIYPEAIDMGSLNSQLRLRAFPYPVLILTDKNKSSVKGHKVGLVTS